MCGIGSITTAKDASPKVLARLDHAASVLLEELDHRGGDACGILTIRADGRCHTVKAPCTARAFNEGRGPIPEGTRAIAVHTRFATQGEAHWNRNNHPVASGGALVLHNGVIWDYRQPQRIPHNEPEVDTYLLAHAASKHADKRKGETIQQHAERITLALTLEEGSAALHLAYRGSPTLITMALEGSPLYFAETNGVRITASTRDAVIKTTHALGLTLTHVPYTYTRTIKKAKRGRPAKTETVNSTREAVYWAEEGTVLVWHAGTHTEGLIQMPLRAPARTWTNHGISASGAYTTTGYHQDDWHDDRIATIAARMLEADNFRCELCDDSSVTRLTPAYGMLCCDACMRSMDTIPDAEKVN